MGVKSTFRCLKSYYKLLATNHSQGYTGKNNNFEDNTVRLVEQLLTTAPAEVPAEDLYFHLTALLQAKSSNLNRAAVKKGSAARRNAKIQRKQLSPDEDQQTRFVEKVLYQTNANLVTEFLTIPSNLFLLRMFTQENGLSSSD